MSHFSLVNITVILGSVDLSGDMNSVSIQRSQEGLPNDTFGSIAVPKTFKARIPGLQDGVFGMAGLVELTALGQDASLSGNMGLTGIPLLLSPRGATDFDRAKFGVVQQGQYQSGGNVGELAAWSADGRISGYVLTDGNIMAVGTKTGTFNGTYRELGAVSAAQKIYATLHATAKNTFTSAVFKVQSADDAGGTNVTDRITFSTVTGLTSEFKVLAGPVTQTFFRVVASSFTGTSLTVYVAVGIS